MKLAGLACISIAVAAATAGCATRVVAPANGGDASTRVRRVVIDGNRAFADRAIISGLELRAPRGTFVRTYDAYDPLVMRLDAQRVEAYYRTRGYFSATVSGADAVPAGRGQVDLHYRVDEGEPSRVTGLDLPGLPLALHDDAVAVGQTLLLRGERFEYEPYTELKDKLRALLGHRGYLRASLDGSVRVDRDRHTVRVIVTVDAGPLVRFGQTNLTNPTAVPDGSITSRIDWEPGQVYDADKLASTRKALYELGAFSTVRIVEVEDDDPAVATMALTVTPNNRNELRLGGGFAVDGLRLETHGRVEYTRRNVFAPLVTFSGRFRPGYVIIPDRQQPRTFVFEARGELRRPDLLWKGLQGSTFVSFEKQVYFAFTTLGPGTGLSLQRSFWDRSLQLSVGWQLRLQDISPDDSTLGAGLGASGTQELAFYEQSAALDRRDDRLRPRLGYYARIAGEEGGSFAAGAVRYTKVSGDLRGYVPLASWLVFATRATAGAISATHTGNAPVTQRFYSGGPSSHRGFAIGALSPLAPNENGKQVPIGGDFMVLGSAELRATVATVADQDLEIGTFVDAGDVTAHAGELDLTQLHVAVGAGLRYDTAVGPIRLDVGVRLNRLDTFQPDGRRNPYPGGRIAIGFSVGEPF